MIKAINLKTLRNGEFLQFIRDTAETLERHGIVELNLTEQHEAMLLKYEETRELYAPMRANPLTRDLRLINLRRNRAITGIRSAIKTFSYHFDAEKNAAAKRLAKHQLHYGKNIIKENVMAKTGIISLMVADWETKPVLAADLTSLGLSEWKDELKAANMVYDDIFIVRIRQKAAKNKATMKQKREETLEAYYDVREMLEAYALTNPEKEVYQSTIKNLNALIKQYNVVLHKRMKKSDGKENVAETQDNDAEEKPDETMKPIAPPD